MFLVPNIDQMYKEMKKIQTGNQSYRERTTQQTTIYKSLDQKK
jgi:hypothetical protein